MQLLMLLLLLHVLCWMWRLPMQSVQEESAGFRLGESGGEEQDCAGERLLSAGAI
jgi:hypothetical protein